MNKEVALEDSTRAMTGGHKELYTSLPVVLPELRIFH